MHIIIGLVLAVFAFAILLRPLRWLLGLWLACLALAFLALIASGILQKLFGVGGGFLDQFGSMWMILAMYITPRAAGVLLVISIIYRAIGELANRSRQNR